MFLISYQSKNYKQKLGTSLQSKESKKDKYLVET